MGGAQRDRPALQACEVDCCLLRGCGTAAHATVGRPQDKGARPNAREGAAGAQHSATLHQLAPPGLRVGQQPLLSDRVDRGRCGCCHHGAAAVRAALRTACPAAAGMQLDTPEGRSKHPCSRGGGSTRHCVMRTRQYTRCWAIMPVRSCGTGGVSHSRLCGRGSLCSRWGGAGPVREGAVTAACR